MKKSNNIKKILALLVCVALLVCSFSACSSSNDDSEVTSSKTDSSVQSDEENSNVQNDKSDSKDNDNSNDKSNKSDKSDSKDKTDKSGDKSSTSNASNNVIKKPSKPSNVTSLQATSVTSSSVTLKWKKVKCDGYRVRVFDVNGNKLKDVTCKSDSYKVTGLDSYTTYEFRVRAYNENDAGKSESEDASITKSTKAATSQRKIKISVRLPENSANTDTLNVYITVGKKTEKIKTAKIKCDGSTYTFTTDKQYKGVVTVKAELVDSKTSDSVKTDKKAVTLNLTRIGIVQIDGEDD